MPSYKGRDACEPSSFASNPYDDFMKKHLSYYGYYTGRNRERTKTSPLFNDFNRTHGYQLGSSEEEDKQQDANTDAKSKQLEYRFEDGRLVSRLREPRQLFAITNPTLGPQQLPRWPAELEVAIERIKHSFNSPPTKEPFYIKCGQELQPTLVSLEEGRTVFELQNLSSPFFLHSRVGGSKSELKQASVELNGPDDSTLQFESRFESGNLAKAVQIGEFSYELWLRNDLYTNKHTQWFYFQIKNTRKGQKYRFTICNFMKSNSLYNDGMKPCYYSEKDNKTMGLGWRRMGSDITYYKSNYSYASGKTERPYYALTFTQTMSHDNDVIYLAHCYPYTYSDLQSYLNDMVEDEKKSKFCKLRILTRSLAGNLVYLLTITSPYNEQQPTVGKKAVVVTARVHPGETNGSWMMKGLLDYLMGESADAKLLRDTFIFKIVPMLNPDGVIVGNYRCSLAGRDLNRNYKTQLTDSYPTIISAKTMIKKLLLEREVVLYCDLHGHSRKQNVFIYGCENRMDKSKRLHERIFPAMLGKNCPDKFAFDECSFKVQKGKEGTGRIVMWNMGIANSFTMEATFCGSSVGNKKSCHFNMKDFESMGYHFCDTLLDYCDPDKTKYDTVLSELENELRSQILKKFARLGKTNIVVNGKTVDLLSSNVNLEELLAASVDLSEDDGGSDSSVSDGLPVNIEYMQNKAKAQRKKTLSKKERDKLKKAAAQRLFMQNGSRVSSASSRHENCHHNQPLVRDKLHGHSRRCLSARHGSDIPSPACSDKVPYRGDTERSAWRHELYRHQEKDESSETEPEHQKAYLDAINKQIMTDGKHRGKPTKGRLRYSTSNSNKPLAMNFSELSENQPERSFAAEYLLTRVNDSVLSDATLLEDHKNSPSWYSRTVTNPDVDKFLYPLTEGSYVDSQKLVSENRPVDPSSWNYASGQKPTDRRMLMKYPRQQAIKQVDMSSALEGNVIKQHPLPFDTVSTKPGHPSADKGHLSRAHSAKQPIKQRSSTAANAAVANNNNNRYLKQKLAANTEELHQQLTTELDDIEQLQENLYADLANTNLKSSGGKYLEKIKMETDNDIEQLRRELHEMSAENGGNRHANKNTILELAARQRRLATTHKPNTSSIAVQTPDSRIQHKMTPSRPAAAHHNDMDHFVNQYKPRTQAKQELIQITSKVSVHMTNHSVPSAPKASRRGQVRATPPLKPQRQ